MKIIVSLLFVLIFSFVAFGQIKCENLTSDYQKLGEIFDEEEQIHENNRLITIRFNF